MSPFSVTIKDFTEWQITVRANDHEHAEQLAWDLFQLAGDRSEHFQEHSDTTVQVEEVRS